MALAFNAFDLPSRHSRRWHLHRPKEGMSGGSFPLPAMALHRLYLRGSLRADWPILNHSKPISSAPFLLLLAYVGSASLSWRSSLR